MNPQYKVRIDVTIGHPVADKSVLMSQVRYLPFVPMVGQVLRLTGMDEDKVDLTLHEVAYDTEAHMFVCSIQDDEQISTYSEQGTCNLTESVQFYESYDFTRITYPVGQVIRADT